MTPKRPKVTRRNIYGIAHDNLFDGSYQTDEFVDETDETSVWATHRLYKSQSLAE